MIDLLVVVATIDESVDWLIGRKREEKKDMKRERNWVLQQEKKV